ncbi:MAG: hypothetical protein JWO60_1336, partial [Frankiales bacterium]|nr:hypothetical protein [Frankiales bacterium]
MTRVLLVDPSARGGIAAYTRRLTEALSLVGQPVTLLASRGLAMAAPLPGVQVRHGLPDHAWGRPDTVGPVFYARRAGHALDAGQALLRAVRRFRPDVVHLQHGVHARLDASIVRALRRTAAVVWTAHDVVPFEGDPHAALGPLRRADLVLVHSEPARQLLHEQGIEAQVVPIMSWGVPEGVDPQQDPGALRGELGLPAGERVLAALGFVRPYKGYALLADVWESLGPAAPVLLVVGEPWSDADTEVLDRLEATGRADVRRGYVDDADLARYALASDALLLPHATASDSGLLHLALALGRPVLSSDAPQLAASVRATGGGSVLPRTV